MDFTWNNDTILDQQDLLSNVDSGYNNALDTMVPQLPAFLLATDFSTKDSISSLRERFICTHPCAIKARKRHEQTRDHPDRVHPANKHVLPPDPEQLPLQEKIRLYLIQKHMPDIRRSVAKSIISSGESKATITRYVIYLEIDPLELLQFCPSLGNQLMGDIDSISPVFHVICCQLLQQIVGEENTLLADQVRLSMRLMYLPNAFTECHLPRIASALELSREDIVNEDCGYNGFFAISGTVSSISLAEHEMQVPMTDINVPSKDEIILRIRKSSLACRYSQTFKCNNPRCHNKNKLHYTPSASQHRVIKSTEDDGFMETATSSTLLQVDLFCNHCALEMPESVLDRVYIKKQTIKLNCNSRFRAKGCFVNQITAVLKDDLVNTVALGEDIQLLGRLSRTFSEEKIQESYSHGVKIEVNNVLHTPNHKLANIPESLASIISRDMSVWNTSQAIVDKIDHLVPGDVHRKLKLALLLSAVSISEQDSDCKSGHVTKNEARQSIHVLVIMNNHDTVIPELMANLATCKKKAYWGHGEKTTRNPLYTIRQPSKVYSGHIQANILSSAKDGILIFELDQLDKKNLSHVAPILSSINGEDISIQCEDSILPLDLVCCCWATYTKIAIPHKHKKSCSPEDGTTVGPGKGVTMIGAFDIVISQIESDGASDVSRSLSSHTLKRYMNDPSEFVGEALTSSDLSTYIHHASNIQVRISFECEGLLKSYFQVMRNRRPGLETNEVSSISVMSTLSRLAICHAKLCFRSIATTDDALVSIMMVEETMAARFGISRLGFAPLPDGKDNATYLYSQPFSHKHVPSQDEFNDLVGLYEYGYELETDLPVTSEACVPMSKEDRRDLVANAMHSHLLRVIGEDL